MLDDIVLLAHAARSRKCVRMSTTKQKETFDVVLIERVQFDNHLAANDNNGRAKTICLSLDAQIIIQKKAIDHWKALECKYIHDDTPVGQWACKRCRDMIKTAEDMLVWLDMKKVGNI